MDTNENDGATKVEPVVPSVAKKGIPGFHPVDGDEERGTDVTGESSGAGGTASEVLDADAKGRVNTGTGDQPGNTGGSRTGTPGPDEQGR